MKNYWTLYPPSAEVSRKDAKGKGAKKRGTLIIKMIMFSD
jgi:hypothetical protein